MTWAHCEVTGILKEISNENTFINTFEIYRLLYWQLSWAPGFHLCASLGKICIYLIHICINSCKWLPCKSALRELLVHKGIAPLASPPQLHALWLSVRQFSPHRILGWKKEMVVHLLLECSCPCHCHCLFKVLIDSSWIFWHFPCISRGVYWSPGSLLFLTFYNVTFAICCACDCQLSTLRMNV